MTGPKQKVETTWLQCMVTKADWDKINARRLALKLTWKDVILPATLAYLDKLESTTKPKPPALQAVTPAQPADKAKAKKQPKIGHER